MYSFLLAAVLFAISISFFLQEKVDKAILYALIGNGMLLGELLYTVKKKKL